MTRTGHSQAHSGPSRLLVAPEWDGVTASWFSPDFWEGKARPVTSGGRGGAWFIDCEPDELVLRHYRRGGLVARLAEKTYLFTGFDHARSLAEFRLLRDLRELGLPVPEAVAAIVWKHRWFWYRAAILVKRIPGAITFPESDRLGDESLWQALGRVIRRFHDHGLDHVDLNCDNILLANGTIYLIDFDRCRLVPERDNNAVPAWKQRNLDRLYRSVEKRCSSLAQSSRDELWQHLLQAYSQPSQSPHIDQA